LPHPEARMSAAWRQIQEGEVAAAAAAVAAAAAAAAAL